MRNIILLSIGSSGDVNPFIFLGSELAMRGHKVTLITNNYFRELALEAGINFEPVGTADEYLELTASPELFHPQKAFGYVVKNFVLRYMKHSYKAIEKHFDGNSLLIAQSIAPGARIAHDKLKIPLLTLNLQPVSFWSVENPPVFSGLKVKPEWPFWLKRNLLGFVEKFFIDPAFSSGINPFLKELGLPVQKNFFSKWMYSPMAVAGLFPEWFATPSADWPLNTKLTGFVNQKITGKADENLLSFIEGGEPPVLFTAGSAMQHAGAFFETAFNWAEANSRRTIMINAFNKQFPQKNSKNVFKCSFAPFGEIFPKLAAVVHHGGIGTVAPAIDAGIPQLIVPFAHDQPDNAERVEKLGLGIKIKPGNFKIKNLDSKLGYILNSPEMAESCRRYSTKMKQDNGLENLIQYISSIC